MRKFPYSSALMQVSIVGAVHFTAGHALAAGMSVSCPLRIPGNVVKADKPVEGWTTTVAEQLHLSGAGMLAGAPATKTYLVPQNDTRTAQTYSFTQGDGERWVWCSYGGGSVELARKLNDKATSCTITTKTTKADNTFSASVVCK
jgi:hypothetical protein